MAIVDPKLVAKIPLLFRSRFSLLLLSYCIYLFFFSQNTIISQVKLAFQVNKLSKEEKYYANEIKKVNQEQKLLFSGVDQMEKYARENYWMKRDSEDLYIFVEEENK